MSDRRAYDAYPTPPATIAAALDRIPLDPTRYILEPCAGAGRILVACAARWPHRGLRAVEIDPQYTDALHALTPVVHVDDFRVWAAEYRATFPDPERCGPGLIIGNPPFSLAQEILDACFAVATPTTPIVMLLRLGFLESRKRHAWWQNHLVDALYVLSERPSFTDDGRSDSSAYAWYVWRGSEKGVFII